MYFQPDGFEGYLLTVMGVGMSLLLAIQIPILIIAGVRGKVEGEPPFPKRTLWFIPLCFLPLLIFGSWYYYSVQGVMETAHVDELYYFDLQHITKDGKDRMVFFDNRGRFLYADRFGKPDDTLVARKRVFRGRSLLISWEWMEFDLVPRRS